MKLPKHFIIGCDNAVGIPVLFKERGGHRRC